MADITGKAYIFLFLLLSDFSNSRILSLSRNVSSRTLYRILFYNIFFTYQIRFLLTQVGNRCRYTPQKNNINLLSILCYQLSAKSHGTVTHMNM